LFPSRAPTTRPWWFDSVGATLAPRIEGAHIAHWQVRIDVTNDASDVGTESGSCTFPRKHTQDRLRVVHLHSRYVVEVGR
jgi:hypothetical protein